MDLCDSKPVRVLHVVTYMGRGGLETMIMNYYRHIDRSKVQFDFLVHRDFKADYDDEIEALGGRIYHLQRLVPWKKSYLNELESFFKNHPEYKIVHVHQDCLSSVILKIAKKCGVKVRIAHSHSSSQDKNLKYLIKLYYKRFIPKYATQLFACGKEAGDWMFGGAKYQIINNAIDTKLYKYNSEKRNSIRNDLKIPEDTFVVGHVGRFNAVKNHTFLLDIIAELKKQHKNSMLLLIGDGELRAKIEDKAKELNVTDDVIFTGVRSDVPDLMQAMDCFVFPSLYEGLPVTLIEAQSSGLPCIVSSEVPSECDKTDLVEHISLSDSLDIWAKHILNKKGNERKNYSEAIAKSGYDINVNAKGLESFYIDNWKG